MMQRGNMLTLLVLTCITTGSRGMNSVKMVFGGDILFNGILEYMVNKDHCTYEESLEKLKPYLKDADYVVANLESVVFRENANEAMESVLNDDIVHSISDATALTALKNVGINCVTVANGHIGDFLDAGINSTCQLCGKHGIQYFGISSGNESRTRQKPLILEKHGIKIGMLGYCATERCLKEETEHNHAGAALLSVQTAIAQAKELREAGCHAVIMYMNWETEYRSILTSQSISKIKRIIKEVKIDLIVGSHPHVTHGHWIVNQTLVASSLGNLISPSYMTADLNFVKPYMNITHKTMWLTYEKLWYKQMRLMNDPSRHGKLLQIEVNKEGIILEKSMYLATRTLSTDKHCMIVDKDILATWTKVCDVLDHQCLGTRECNYIECDGKDPLPFNFNNE